MVRPFKRKKNALAGDASRGAACARVGLACAVLLGFASAAMADLTVEPGDVLRISVREDDSLNHDAPVNVDGTIMLAQVGPIAVAGADLAAIQSRIEAALIEQQVLREATVLVQVTEYRPFYVGGAVARPGAIPFRPGIKVRQAIILAGGLDIMQGRDSTPGPSDLAELRARLQFSSYELFQVDSQIARINAELGQGADQASPPDPGLVPPEEASDLLALDANLLAIRVEAFNAEKEFLRSSLSLIETEIDILHRQAGFQQGEQSLQRREVEDARGLVDRGLKPRAQLQELERELSRMSRDLLENQAFTARAGQDRVAKIHDLETIETRRDIDIRDGLRQALKDRARIVSEMNILRERLRAMGLQLTSGSELIPTEPSVVIYRDDGSGKGKREADMEDAILPGDAVEVSLAVPADG